MIPTKEQLALYEFMCHLSEEYWSAGWLMDLEKSMSYALKNDNLTMNRKYKLLSDSDFARLRELQSAAGGWWIWKDDAEPNEHCENDLVVFVAGDP